MRFSKKKLRVFLNNCVFFKKNCPIFFHSCGRDLTIITKLNLIPLKEQTIPAN